MKTEELQKRKRKHSKTPKTPNIFNEKTKRKHEHIISIVIIA